jgi:PadR family transcriptional regulator AphA
MNLTPTSYIVLGLLDAAGPTTPYGLKRMWGPDAGLWSVPHTQLYKEPERLAAGGYVKESREQAGRRRRTYRITAKGRKALRDWLAAPADVLAELRDPGLLQLFFGADPVPLAEVQLEAHRRKLDEYLALRENLPEGGPRRALDAGIGHEREYVRFWSGLARG